MNGFIHGPYVMRWGDDGQPSKMFCDTGESWVLHPLENRDRVLAILRRLADHNNTHTAHQRADAALLAYLGDEDIREAFEAIHKWYS